MTVWQNKNFVRVWTGQFVSTIGDGMHTVAILWWVKVSTGFDALAAAIALSSAVAAVLLSPVGGVYADRVERRRVMISVDAARAALDDLHSRGQPVRLLWAGAGRLDAATRAGRAVAVGELDQ